MLRHKFSLVAAAIAVAAIGLTGGAIALNAGGASNNAQSIVLGDNGPAVNVTCADSSAAAEAQPLASGKGFHDWCWNPYATTTTTTAPTTTTTVPQSSTTTTTSPPTTTTTLPNTGLSMGSYNGAGNYGGNLAFGSETGTTVTNYSDYTDSTSECNTGEPYPLGLLKGHLAGQRLILSVPLSGFRLGVNGQQLLASDAANPNPWNACMTQLASYLVSDGFSNAIIRLMWEPDSGIYSSGDLTSAANYATVWRNTWNAMSAVSGQHFAWAWYWGGNFDNTTNTTAWPGSQYVDYVTFDQYDQSWDGSCGAPYNGSNFTPAQSQCIWDGDINQHLNGLLNFAGLQGKPVGIGEWGVINRGDGHGGGDDPTFINNMTAWEKAHAAWISYFNFNSGGDSILSDFPNSLNAYKADL